MKKLKRAKFTMFNIGDYKYILYSKGVDKWWCLSNKIKAHNMLEQPDCEWYELIN